MKRNPLEFDYPDYRRGLAATIVVAFLVTKKAKEKLKEAGVGEDSREKDSCKA